MSWKDFASSRPLYFDLLDAADKEFAKKRLIRALDNYGWRVGTGFLSTPFILYVLAEIDPAYAYRLLENEGKPGGHFSHAGMTYDSVYGKVGCSWKRCADGTYIYHIFVPPNTTAEVSLPGCKAQTLPSGEYDL